MKYDQTVTEVIAALRILFRATVPQLLASEMLTTTKAVTVRAALGRLVKAGLATHTPGGRKRGSGARLHGTWALTGAAMTLPVIAPPPAPRRVIDPLPERTIRRNERPPKFVTTPDLKGLVLQQLSRGNGRIS